nr:hypothetical protein [Tanacetum cinerariifolium]
NKGDNDNDESSNDDDDDDVEKDEEEKEEEEHQAPAYPSDVSTDDLVGHIIQNCRTPATAKNQRTRTCCECGSLRHYKSECQIVKFHKHVDMIHGRMRASKPKTMQDAIKIATKLRNKKISTLVECQTENKKRLDNTSKNNQNQQQPNERQNTGKAYCKAWGEETLRRI